ncbi:hypothetical protein VPNG_04865 [Cytospora leucostoma]|uniref:Peptidase M20 dimerisation domain-containing protein n=1 Tax=Cytospora leucostoma TaxID=1230097 RepID=A0A423XBE3_9PEZI|nr:hypothetical protein VPNG_04865 [Cytospora leucostoma]
MFDVPALGLLSILYLPNTCIAAWRSDAGPGNAINHDIRDLNGSHNWESGCPQLSPLLPKKSENLSLMDEYLASAEFFKASVQRVSQAVRIDTTSNDDMRNLPGNHSAWNHMYNFSRYLKDTFPFIHESLTLDRINTHGLVYTWQGKNSSLHPTILLAHQDVVPVQPETENHWTHPPFSGDFDGTYVWGRGAFDCKSTLIASLEAVEQLLEAGYAPERTVVLAFGFDEEISGDQGAKHIAKSLERRYGEDGVALLIDEGPGIFQSLIPGSSYALPGLAEKGYLDVEVVVHMRTGHSFMPPKHNSITVMAELIRKLEESPFQVQLHNTNPILDTILCLGQHEPRAAPILSGMNWNVIKQIAKYITSGNEFLGLLAAFPPFTQPLIRTTQSSSIISGGLKANIVPERTSLIINHRIVHGTTVNDVKDHLTQVVRTFVEGFNGENHEKGFLRFIGWDQEHEDIDTISLRTRPGYSEPSPITPSSVDGTTPYSVLHGTIQALYGADITVVVPFVAPASTDSRHYNKLTKHIFRFSPGSDVADATDNVHHSHAHGTDERVNMRGHVNAVRWYSMFIRNMDEANLD